MADKCSDWCVWKGGTRALYGSNVPKITVIKSSYKIQFILYKDEAGDFQGGEMNLFTSVKKSANSEQNPEALKQERMTKAVEDEKVVRQKIDDCVKIARDNSSRLTNLAKDYPEVVADFLDVKLLRDYDYARGARDTDPVRKNALGEVMGRYTFKYLDLETIDVGLKESIASNLQKSIADCEARRK